MLHVVFAGAVGVEGTDGVTLVNRKAFRFAIDSVAGRRVDNFLDLVPAAAFQQVHRSNQVDISIENRFLKRLSDIGPGCLVGNIVGMDHLKDLFESFFSNIQLVEGRPRRKVFDLSRGKVIHYRNLVARLEESVNNMRSDKSCTTCH